jgi:hypothetical protein
LAWAKTGDQHGTPVGNFQGVVVHTDPIQIDLTKPRNRCAEPAKSHAWQQASQRMVAFYLFLEREFGAGQ